MNEIVINDKLLSVKEYKGNRVVTFKEIDAVHGRKEGTASRNFNANKKRFIEDVDYFRLQNNEIRSLGINVPNRGLIVITESGYLMLAKSFTDDLAWTVQRELVNFYFRKNAPELPAELPEDTEPQAAYTGAQRLGDVVELAKLTAKLMKDSKRSPSDILFTIGAQLEHFGVMLPDGFYTTGFSQGAAAERSAVVAQFLEEFGDITGMPVREVYNEYCEYCRRLGRAPISTTYAFGNEIVKHTGKRSKAAHRNGVVVRVYTDE